MLKKQIKKSLKIAIFSSVSFVLLLSTLLSSQLSFYANAEVSTLKGDADLDGMITDNDTWLMIQHINGWGELTGQAFINAAISYEVEDIIDELDIHATKQCIMNGGNSPVCYNFYPVMKGDVNLDAELDDSDLKEFQTALSMPDGYFNGLEYINAATVWQPYNKVDELDMHALIQCLNQGGAYPYCYNMSPVMIGDANTDGQITQDDVERISAHVNGAITLEGLQYINAADAWEKDNEIDVLDIHSVKQCLAQGGSYPGCYNGIYIKGDANEDTLINKRDLKLINKHLNGQQHLEGMAYINVATVWEKHNSIDKLDYHAVMQCIMQGGNYPYCYNMAPVMKGDANTDGQIDDSDIKLMKSYISGITNLRGLKYINTATVWDQTSEIDELDMHAAIHCINQGGAYPYCYNFAPVMRGDVNTDFKVDETDVKLIKQYLSSIGSNTKIEGLGYINAATAWNPQNKINSIDARAVKYCVEHGGDSPSCYEGFSPYTIDFREWKLR